jgi:hypothetical protein
MQAPVRWLSRTLPLLLALPGCTGTVDGEGRQLAGAPGNAGTAGAGAGSGGQSSADCSKVSAPALHARLLTPSQYEHTVEDLLKVVDHPAKEFGGGVSAKLDEVGVERRANAAAVIAGKAAASLSAWSPCVPPAVDAASCQATLIDKLGLAAFRHPLAASERAELQALFDAGVKEKDFSTGVDWFLTGLLQAPDFLYQLSKPQSGEVAGQVVPLEGYELASRLAFFMWDSSPDEALFAAASTGKLSDAQQLGVELQRLLGDARFARGTASFYSNWLGLEGFKEVARDDVGLTTEVLGTLERSLLMSATELYRAEAPNIESLFSGQQYYLNDKLLAFYGESGGNAQLAAVDLPNQGRYGILTHPGLMTLLARPNASDPIARGLFLQRTVFCHEIPPPPQGVTIPPLAPVAPGSSTRARLEQHTTQPLCKGCHDHIDPPGFALESFDAVGRFRTQDAGVPVDSSGTMASGVDVDGAFASGGELLERIAHSSDVKKCFAQHYLSHAVLRDLSNEDACSLSRVTDGFAQSGDLKQLVLAIAGSDAFRMRMSEGVAP